MTVSVLIGWRSADPARIRLWEHCRPLWDAWDVQLCVADDGAQDGPFSRAKAFNRAAEQATGDVLITWGADMLPDAYAIADAVVVATEHGWSLVFDHSAAFSAPQTDAVLEGVEPWSLHPRVTKVDVPGVLAVRRDVWAAVGGMDERFGTGYGYEDCALRNLLANRYGTHRATASHTLDCLWHPHTERPSARNHRVFWDEYAGLARHLN